MAILTRRQFLGLRNDLQWYRILNALDVNDPLSSTKFDSLNEDEKRYEFYRVLSGIPTGVIQAVIDLGGVPPPPLSQPKMVYVETDGVNGTAVIGRRDKPFQTAQAAFNAANAGAGDHILMFGVGSFGGITLDNIAWPTRIKIMGGGRLSVIGEINANGTPGVFGVGAANGTNGGAGPNIILRAENVSIQSVTSMGGEGGGSDVGTGGIGGPGGAVVVNGNFYLWGDQIASQGGQGGSTPFDPSGIPGNGGNGGNVVVSGCVCPFDGNGQMEIWSGGGGAGLDSLSNPNGVGGTGGNVNVTNVRSENTVGQVQISSESGIGSSPSSGGDIYVTDCGVTQWIRSFDALSDSVTGTVTVIGVVMGADLGFQLGGNVVNAACTYSEAVNANTLNNLGGNGGPGFP